jgi:hypothetical protein
MPQSRMARRTNPAIGFDELWGFFRWMSRISVSWEDLIAAMAVPEAGIDSALKPILA